MRTLTAVPALSKPYYAGRAGARTGLASCRWLAHLLATLACAVMASAAMADAVTDWNQTTIDVLKTGSVLGNPWSRCMAMVHVAIADAVNTIQGRYTRYAVASPAAANASKTLEISSGLPWIAAGE